MKITKITTYGDSELVVQQVKSVYQTKHPIMRSYKNQAWDLIENLFDAFNIVAIPREENHRANALAIVANTFKVPINIKLRYEIKVRYRSSIPDNVRHWQVFEDDQQIKRFLEIVEEFNNTHMDQTYKEEKVEEDEDAKQPIEIFLNHIGEHKVLQ